MTRGKLYVAATPIGNLSDISKRALDILEQVDFIAAEDTRTSKTLLNHFDIKTPMVSYHKFNENFRAEEIIRKILDGQTAALITDAGTPCISDPGAVLVEGAYRAGIEVTAIPGACSVSAALSVCGYRGIGYKFHGFFSKKKTALESGINVFFESPYRIVETIKFIADAHNDANICCCNDLTKMYERVYRGTAAEVLKELESNPSAEKGEYVIVLEFFAKESREEALEFSIEGHLVDIMVKNGVTAKEAVSIFKQQHPDFAKKEIYAAMLNVGKLFGAMGMPHRKY